MNLHEITFPINEQAAQLTYAVNGSEERVFKEQSLHKLNLLLQWKDDQKTIKKWGENLLNELVPFVKGLQGTFFSYQPQTQELILEATFAHDSEQETKHTYSLGEGFIGQAAKNQKPMIIENNKATASLTSFNHIRLKTLMVFPLIYQNQTLGVVELNFAQTPKKYVHNFLNEAFEGIASNLYTFEQLLNTQEQTENPQIYTETLPTQTSIDINDSEWRALAMLSQQAIVVVAEDWCILDCNPAFEELFGDTQNKDNNLRAYLNVMSYDIISIKEKLYKGESCESIGIHKTGQTFRVELKSYPSQSAQYKGIIVEAYP